MLQQYHTKLKGTLALTDSYQTEKTLQKEKGLYKFIWVRKGSITVEIDHQEMLMSQDDVISLTHLQHLEFKSIDGEYTTLLFNSNFYCTAMTMRCRAAVSSSTVRPTLSASPSTSRNAGN
jgi:hypothetical protein